MSDITATICPKGLSCEACDRSGETVPASYSVTSRHLRSLSIYDPTAFLCDCHLDILHENVDD